MTVNSCHQNRVVQALGLLGYTFQVHLPARQSSTPRRDPIGNLRKPYGSVNLGWQSLQIRLLLADGPGRRPGHCQMMPKVPILLKAATHPGSGPADDPSILAIRLLGTRLGGSTQGGTRWLYPYIHHNRQIHQVDRGEASLIYVSSQGSRVH